VDDFHDPWSYEIETEWSILSENQTQIMVIDHFFTTLETDARSFGLSSPSKIDKKLTRSPLARVDKSPYGSHGFHPYLWVMWAPQVRSRAVSRSYTSFLDAAGNVGG
jgi:hypothetical protein